ncbi:MAG: metallopeptidase family protein [Verrucomicrobiota bacterium]
MDALAKHLHHLARTEVDTTIQRLPPDLRLHAQRLPVALEPWPNETLVQEGWDPDLLGMFVGDSLGVPEHERQPLPAQILLFVENLWDYAGEDEDTYREEVRVTYLHELGHFLGLDEDDLDRRGLL